jgi:hypothetical protein
MELLTLLTLLTSELRAVADAEGARRIGGWVVIKSAAEGRRLLTMVRKQRWSLGTGTRAKVGGYVLWRHREMVVR